MFRFHERAQGHFERKRHMGSSLYSPRWRGWSVERPMSRLVCIPDTVKASQTQRASSTTTPSAPPMSHWSHNQWYIILTVTRDHWGGAYTSTGTITTHYQTIWHSPSAATKDPGEDRRPGTVIDAHCRCRRPHGERRANEDEEIEKKSLSSPATPGSVSNVTSLIRDARTMQRGWRRGRVWSNQGSCIHWPTVCAHLQHFVHHQAPGQVCFRLGVSTSLTGN